VLRSAFTMKKVLFFFLSLISLFFSLCLYAQEKDGLGFQRNYQLTVKKTADKIILDGLLNETAWTNAKQVGDFWEKWPHDDKKARKQTTVKACFDNNYLYIAATCYDTTYHVIQTLKRDSRFFESDGFAVLIDPVNQRTNGFLFGVSPHNVQAEDLVSANSSGNINFSWDNKWLSATHIEADRWTVEMAIPFKTLRYTGNKTTWGINFIRNDLKHNEYHTWTNVPLNFNGFDLGYTGSLVWETPPPPQGSNIAFIPYITGAVMNDREENTGYEATMDGGFDAKVSVSSTMNLDITVNPDFSQVDVDQQVTNLTRFNIFFPERRTFFLENSDVFVEYGIPPIRPFYSRTIGLDSSGNRIPILGGLRLSGNLNKNLRVGIMNMQTRSTSSYAAQNYSAVSLHQRIFSRSLIKAYFLNRQAFLDKDEKKQKPLEAYGRNAGLEFNFTNKKGDWNAWIGHHLSFKPDISKSRSFFNAGAGYFGRHFSMLLDYAGAGTNYYTDMGFVERISNYDALRDTSVRLGFKQLYHQMEYLWNPAKGNIITHRLSLENFIVHNPNNTPNEQQHSLRYSVGFRNTGNVSIEVSNQQVDLQFPARFTDDNADKPLPVAHYSFSQGELAFNTDTRRKLVLEGSVSIGGFYNGTRRQYRAGITFRQQPWGNFSINFEQNTLRFPDGFGKADLFLIAPRIEINFSTAIFWTTFIQYNTQRNNLNFNSRLQYRFRPMSDFFLVYTDNYFTDPLFRNKNRTLVFKLNYWLNL
jgi:Domain of unknown function (DUF5916)/Carbohydrate family 9 binding domain-like